jgi:hypothetical protein
METCSLGDTSRSEGCYMQPFLLHLKDEDSVQQQNREVGNRIVYEYSFIPTVLFCVILCNYATILCP